MKQLNLPQESLDWPSGPEIIEVHTNPDHSLNLSLARGRDFKLQGTNYDGAPRRRCGATSEGPHGCHVKPLKPTRLFRFGLSTSRENTNHHVPVTDL